MNNVFPKCKLCGSNPRYGLYDGFRLGKKFICSACEQRIIHADIGDFEYDRNIGNIKKLLYG